MEVQEVKDKLTSVIATLTELVDEFKGGTTIGVLTQQVHAELTGSLRTVTVVLNNVQEAEQASQDEETREGLPRRAPSPASDADQSES
jgi:hypothetical protein